MTVILTVRHYANGEPDQITKYVSHEVGYVRSGQEVVSPRVLRVTA